MAEWRLSLKALQDWMPCSESSSKTDKNLLLTFLRNCVNCQRCGEVCTDNACVLFSVILENPFPHKVSRAC